MCYFHQTIAPNHPAHYPSPPKKQTNKTKNRDADEGKELKFLQRIYFWKRGWKCENVVKLCNTLSFHLLFYHSEFFFIQKHLIYIYVWKLVCTAAILAFVKYHLDFLLQFRGASDILHSAVFFWGSCGDLWPYVWPWNWCGICCSHSLWNEGTDYFVWPFW